MSARATCACGWTQTYSTVERAETLVAGHACKRAVRRATRRFRCARCGLEAVYENAGATEARYWFTRHSCRKYELTMLRSTLARQKRDLVDRTPQPCLHKVARHEHGTRACYCLDRCRCLPCSKANSVAENERERLKAYGRYNKYVPGEFVRDHLRELREYGIGLKHVSTLSGVANGTLTKIWYGTFEVTGRGHERRHGQGKLLRGPSRRVLRKTAEAIYAIEPTPTNLPPKACDHERTPTARLHLRALVALGWSQAKIADRIGVQGGNFTRVIMADQPMARSTVDRVEALYAELCMTLPPEAHHRDKIAASRSRRRARELGWLPPLALDDEPELLEEISDDVDEVAIQRRMNGDRAVQLNRDEAVELVRRWKASGRPLNECERVTGLKPERYYQTPAGAHTLGKAAAPAGLPSPHESPQEASA